MLGYGNFAVRINDPRVQPRTWLPDSDMDAEELVAAMVNCMVGELRGTITAWWVMLRLYLCVVQRRLDTIWTRWTLDN